MVDVLSALTRAIEPEIVRLPFNVKDFTTRVCVSWDPSKPQRGDSGQPLVNSSSSLLVGTESRIALQTSQALIKGNVPGRVRVPFDSGSHKSFITTKAANSYVFRNCKKRMGNY